MSSQSRGAYYVSRKLPVPCNLFLGLVRVIPTTTFPLLETFVLAVAILVITSAAHIIFDSLVSGNIVLIFSLIDDLHPAQNSSPLIPSSSSARSASAIGVQ